MGPVEYANSSANGELETEYPGWPILMAFTKQAIQDQNKKYDSSLAELLIHALAVDSECEQIEESIKQELVPIEEFCMQAMRSAQHHARWQIAELLGHKEPELAEPILIEMIRSDDDSYVKRRALLSLVRVDLDSAKIEAEHFLTDQDDIFRRISNEIKNK